ncbi:MAG: hypothetical protein BHV87_05735 [Clostridiales bacterium 36_14]|nr:MAG: hypothetical protein BHV87_05735 [Clostridiales bacterium 36_14]
MNSALDKVGVYDFFGVLLSGMIVIVVSCCLDLPLINLIANVENDIVNAILFLVGSFFLGLVLQEISSVLDKKVFKFRENARCKFLNDENKIIGNELELKSFRELANKILNKSNDDQVYNETENEYVFYLCKTFLETHEKCDKANKINSLYAMSRSLIISMPLCLSAYYRYNIKLFSFSRQDLVVTFIMAMLTVIFYKRAKRFAAYRVRVILRQYKILNEKN